LKRKSILLTTDSNKTDLDFQLKKKQKVPEKVVDENKEEEKEEKGEKEEKKKI